MGMHIRKAKAKRMKIIIRKNTMKPSKVSTSKSIDIDLKNIK